MNSRGDRHYLFAALLCTLISGCEPYDANLKTSDALLISNVVLIRSKGGDSIAQFSRATFSRADTSTPLSDAHVFLNGIELLYDSSRRWFQSDSIPTPSVRNWTVQDGGTIAGYATKIPAAIPITYCNLKAGDTIWVDDTNATIKWGPIIGQNLDITYSIIDLQDPTHYIYPYSKEARWFYRYDDGFCPSTIFNFFDSSATYDKAGKATLTITRDVGYFHYETKNESKDWFTTYQLYDDAELQIPVVLARRH